MANLLVLDDDSAQRKALALTLTVRHGHQVRTGPVSSVGRTLSDLCRHGRLAPDALIIDPFDSELDALLVLRMVRLASARAILVVTRSNSEADIIAAFRAGADGFVSKPCSAAVLHARIAALLRWAAPAPAPAAVTAGELRLEIDTRSVSLGGRPISLTRAEFDLLARLAAQPGKVLSRTGLTWSGGTNSVDVLLSRLRAKLGETARRPRYLHTFRGRGIALRVPGLSERP